MRASGRARSVLVLALFAITACGGSSGPAATGGGSGGSGGTDGGAAGASGGAGVGMGGSAGGGCGAAMTGPGGISSGAAGTAGGSGGAGGVGGASAGAGGAGGGAGQATGGAAAGAAGASGAGGLAGGGRGGAGGAGGTAGGSAGAAATGGAPAFGLEYASVSAVSTIFQIKLTVLGPSTPNVGAIRFRYYFTDDSGQGSVNPVIDTAKWTIASASSTVDIRSSGCSVVVTVRKTPATSYADVGCGLSSPVAVGDVLTFAVHFDPSQVPANDYSFLNTVGSFVANARMLVMINGLVVLGTPAP